MIEDYNPWWVSRDRIGEVEAYRRFEESDVRWIPDVVDRLSLRPFSLNFVFGPRQVGKTTALVLLAKRLLDGGVDPSAIFYLSCDRLADYRELDEVLGDYLRFRRANGVSSSFMLLDEVTYPREWHRALKGRIDGGDLRNDVLVVTGSLSMSAKGEMEAFPGRRGMGRNLLMLPLPFPRYAELLGLKVPRGGLDFALSGSARYSHLVTELNDALGRYLVTGGFPSAVRENFRTGRVPRGVVADFISSVASDINKLRRSETFFKLAVRGIIERTSSELSYQTLARSFGVGTVKTAISYVELLERLYLLKVVEQVDQDGNVLVRRGKKLYFTDPFIYRALSSWTFADVPDESKLVEGVVATHLSRLFDVFYARAGEREIDVAIKGDGDMVGLEVKFGRVRGLARALGKIRRLYVLSRDEVDGNVIPASLFLAMLDVPQSVELNVLA